MRTRITAAAIIILLLLMLGLARNIHAQEVVTDNNITAGARAMGMGGAQIAAAEDVTAVIHNPAALARIKTPEFQIGLVNLQRKIETSLSSNFTSGSGRANESYTGLSTLGFAYPILTDRGSLVFALAYNRVKDFSGIFKMNDYNEYAFEQDGETWAGNETHEVIEEGGLGVISLAGAVDVSPNVSLGASLDMWMGSYKIDKRLLRNDSPGEVSWLDITGGEDEISALSFKPSILYFNKNFRFGAFMRFPMTFRIQQDNYEELYSRNDGYFFHIHHNIDPYSGSDYLDGDPDYWNTTYKIKAPMQLGLGISWGTAGKHLVAFDMVYEDWKDAEFEDEYDPYYFSDKYRSALNMRLGFENKLPVFNTVGRIGYVRQPMTFKGPRGDDYDSPFIDVVNRRDYITLGLSKKFDESLTLDAAYAHGFWSMEEGARKDEENHNRLYLSLTYRLPEKYR